MNEQEARSYFSVLHRRLTGRPTPQQQLRQLASSQGDELPFELQQQELEEHYRTDACNPSQQCCSIPTTRSALFWWIPRHLPFFLLALFRAATNPEVFSPRQSWRRPQLPSFSGSFPPPPFAHDEHEGSFLHQEDRLSTYLFDMTSSGLGHGVPESICRAAPAMVDLTAYVLTEALPFSTPLNADLTGTAQPLFSTSSASCFRCFSPHTIQ